MDSDVIKQFKDICKINFVLTAIENAVFLVIGKWDYTVLIGSLWGFAMTSIFFYLISVSVTKALRFEDVQLAQKAMKVSQIERLLVLGVGIVLAIKLSFINAVAAIIPLLFTSISIRIYHFRRREE